MGGSDHSLTKAKSVLQFCLATVVGTLFSTAIAVPTLNEWSVSFAVSWFATILLGMLIVAPLIVLVAEELLFKGRLIDRRSPFEVAGILILISLSSIAVFAQDEYPIAYLPAIACMLAAFRLGPIGAAMSVMIISVIGSAAIANDIGPLHMIEGGTTAIVYYFQLYLLLITFASLPLAASMLHREEMLSELGRTNELLEMAEREANLGHWHITLADKKVYWSPQMFAIHGMIGCETPEIEIAKRMCHPDDFKRVEGTVASSIEKGVSYRMVIRITRADGEVRHIDSYGAPEFDLNGRVVGMFGTFQDITERMKALHQLQAAKRIAEREARNSKLLAETDALTGIFNRRKILSVLEELIEENLEKGEELSLAILDVDHFKSINDGFGHQVGDMVLHKVAKIGQVNLRSSDFIGRLGGEEFLIVMPGANSAMANEIVERLRIAVAQSDWSETDGAPVTGSFGVATMMEGADETWLLQAADNALYEAKRSGRNCMKVADSAKAA
jgi:diguanylate cyclase (GGDEF)-like protein/PAS domain S-box-containing protein